MKTNLWALWCFLLFGAFLSFAQTTAIPDANFEQALIDQNIDSDGMLNGQVPTADIANRSSLSINNVNITDFTGLQDFSNLEFLTYDSSTVVTLNLPSGAPLLRSIRIRNHPNLSTVVIPPSNELESIIISNCNLTSFVLTGSFPILEDLYLTGNNLTSLDVSQLELSDLRLSNNQITELILGLSFFYENLNLTNNNLRVLNLSDTSNNNQNITDLNINDNPNLECVQVNDPANIPTSWTFTTNVNPSFSANCYVTIPDANFEQELIAQGIDSDGVVNGQALKQDLRTVTSLDVSSENIADLTGIEAFLALENLNVSANLNLSSLDLSSNLNLKVFTDVSSGLTSAPDFGSNTGLEVINISQASFTAIDLSLISALESLLLNGNGLTNITLGNKPNLTNLSIRSNPLNTIDISGATGLNFISADFSSLASLDLSQNIALISLRAQATQLTELDFSGNPVITTAIIGNNPNLNYVNLKNDNRQDLTLLDMQSNPKLICVAVDDLSFVQSFPSWRKGAQTSYSTGCFTLIPDANFEQELISQNIDSDGIINGRAFTSDVASVTNLSLFNQIADFTGIEDFTSLQVFQVGGSNTGPSNISLDVSNSTQLETLNLNIPGLISLVLPTGNLLKFLGFSDSPITNIDLTQSVGLEEVRLERNALSSLDVSTLINLERLEVNNNQLAQLNTSQNSNLQFLATSNNPITGLDLSTNISLTGLLSQNSNLTSLILKTGNGTNDISQIFVTGNPNLECIEVDDSNNIPSGWQKDATASYSESCGPRPVFLNLPTEISEAYTATIEFDRVVTGFELSDITATGATLSSFQAISGTEYTVLVIPTSVCSSSLTLEIPANVAEDTQNKQNSASGVLTINTVDEESPTVLLQNITISLNASGDATISGADIDNGSSDNCTLAADLNFSLGQFLFTCNDLGTNAVSVLVNDAEGNTQAGSVVVTVEDNINPTASAQNLTIQLNASGNGSITSQQIDNGSSDNCSVASLSLDKTDFNCSDVGQNTVALTVTDPMGNTDTTTAIVTVEEDPNQPLTAIAQDITVQLDAAGQASISPQDIDNGSGSGCSNITLSLDIDTFDCSDLGANTVTLTVSEGSTSETATATVTVEDTLGPNLILEDVTIDIEADGTSTISVADVDNGTNDNCSSEADITMSLDITSFDCADLGANTVTVTATDALGNTSAATAIVMVADTTSPTVITQDITVALDANGQASIAAMDIDNGSSDACSGIASIRLDINEFNCPPLGANVVNLIVTDNDGNTATAAATVTFTAMDEDNNGIADDCETRELIALKGFSPNGDGINDTWAIENIADYPNGKVSVFNRWGVKVFEATGYNNDWNGTSTEGGGNKQLPAGAYLYVIETNDAEFAPQQGWVYINY